MTYEGFEISEMNAEQLSKGLIEIYKSLARVRGHKLRDRLHRQKEEMQNALIEIEKDMQK